MFVKTLSNKKKKEKRKKAKKLVSNEILRVSKCSNKELSKRKESQNVHFSVDKTEIFIGDIL